MDNFGSSKGGGFPGLESAGGRGCRVMETSHDTLPGFVAFIGGFILSASNMIDLSRTIESFRITCRQEIALCITFQR